MANDLFIDLSDLDVSEVEILTHEGSLGMTPFAASTASCGQCCAKGACSCSVDEADDNPVEE